MIVNKEGLTYLAGPTDLKGYRRVRFDETADGGNGAIVYAAAADKADGTLAQDFIVGNGSLYAAILPWHLPGTRRFVASGPIPAHGFYTNDADGKITAGTAANAKGRLHRTAATADGDIVEGSPFSNAD